jgi:ATP-dependent Lon protease
LHKIKSDEALLNPRFLKNARQQLDDDHFGLEKIKRRLVEHLAIVRLKRLEFTIAENRLKASQIESPPAGASPSTSLVPKGMTKAEPRKSKGIKGPILL